MRPCRLAAFVLAVAAAIGIHRAPFARAGGIDWTGRPAPEIHVASGLRGVAPGAQLANYRGTVLVLKFFFAGCPTCRASLPGFDQLARRYAGRAEVRFLALAYDSYENVEPLVRPYSFAVGLDPSGVTAHRYGIETYPTNYVIGADGVVASYDDTSPWVIDRAIQAAQPAVDPKVVEEALRRRRVAELGEVPAALFPVTAAAEANDYGAVLRAVEAHLDPARDAAEVVAASRRIQAVAYARFLARASRILAGWSVDRAAAWRAIDAFVSDFRGTSKEQSLAEWVVGLGPRPVAVAVRR